MRLPLNSIALREDPAGFPRRFYLHTVGSKAGMICILGGQGRKRSEGSLGLSPWAFFGAAYENPFGQMGYDLALIVDFPWVGALPEASNGNHPTELLFGPKQAVRKKLKDALKKGLHVASIMLRHV